MAFAVSGTQVGDGIAQALLHFPFDIDQRQAQALGQLARDTRAIGLDITGHDQVKVAMQAVVTRFHRANRGTKRPGGPAVRQMNSCRDAG